MCRRLWMQRAVTQEGCKKHSSIKPNINVVQLLPRQSILTHCPGGGGDELYNKCISSTLCFGSPQRPHGWKHLQHSILATNSTQVALFSHASAHCRFARRLPSNIEAPRKKTPLTHESAPRIITHCSIISMADTTPTHIPLFASPYSRDEPLPLSWIILELCKVPRV